MKEKELDTVVAKGYDLGNIYSYHAPFGTQGERTLALRKVEEAVMWANASIARNEKETT